MKELIKEPKVVRFWHQLYVEMQADPTDLRSDTDFYTELGIEKSTFVSWKRLYRTFIFREVEQLRKAYRNEDRTAGRKALMKKVASGDTNAIKLLFQLMGDLVEKTEIKTENMSDEDKKRRILSLRSEVAQRERMWDSAAPVDNPTSEPLPDLPGGPTRPVVPECEGSDQGAGN